MKILVIGAGMSGLTAARILQKNGHEVTVLDKGGGFGGRMATRRLGGARIDYGAQYFSAKTPAFQAVVAEAEAAGAIRKWQPSHVADGYTRWVGADGMTRFPKFLAEGLNVKKKTRVARLSERENGWNAVTEGGETYFAEAVVSTMPAPQALVLLENSGLDFPKTREELGRIKYESCLAVLARLDEPSQLASLMPSELQSTHPVVWLASNRAKGITDEPSVTMEATPGFSQRHLDEDLNQAAEIILTKTRPLLEPAKVVEWQIHRWRYSLAEERHPQKFWKAESKAPLFFGGDGFGVGNVEGAFLSGKAIAEEINNEA